MNRDIFPNTAKYNDFTNNTQCCIEKSFNYLYTLLPEIIKTSQSLKIFIYGICMKVVRDFIKCFSHCKQGTKSFQFLLKKNIYQMLIFDGCAICFQNLKSIMVCQFSEHSLRDYHNSFFQLLKCEILGVASVYNSCHHSSKIFCSIEVQS